MRIWIAFGSDHIISVNIQFTRIVMLGSEELHRDSSKVQGLNHVHGRLICAESVIMDS